MSEAPPEAAILVVDDTPANIGVLLDGLGSRGYAVMVAESGVSALEQLAYRLPDLVLLDVNMPGMDGFEVCRRLRAKPAWRDLPVIFMTARDAVEDKVAAFRAGAVDYVTKPIEVDEVVARVGTHLELRQLRRDLEQRNAELSEEVAMRHEVETTLAGSLAEAVLVCDEQGRIRFSTRLAQDWMYLYFSDSEEGMLPDPLGAAIKRVEGETRSTSVRATPLRVGALHGVGTQGYTIVYLENGDAGSRLDDLVSMGLTPRQAEVLFWIAQGKTNPEIALILEASVRTIHKHVENLFQKLGVENRQAAALRAREHLDHSNPIR